MKRIFSYFRYHLDLSPNQVKGSAIVICIALFFVLGQIFIDQTKNQTVSLDEKKLLDSLVIEHQGFVDSMKFAQRDTVFLNTSETKSFMKIKGVGKVLSQRIVDYREKLGGFYTVNQLSEVKGVPVIDSMEIVLVCNDHKIKKINVNDVVYKDLVRHPYINAKQAKMILGYKKKIKRYKSIDDLSRVYALDSNDVFRLKHYIQF